MAWSTAEACAATPRSGDLTQALKTQRSGDARVFVPRDAARARVVRRGGEVLREEVRGEQFGLESEGCEVGTVG